MPKLTNGTTDVPNDPNLARAYCEGRRLAKAAGTITYATAATGSEGANNGIAWTSLLTGDGVRVRLVDPGAESQALAASEDINTFTVTVSLATDGAGVITSTAAQVQAALAGFALVSFADLGASTGAGVVEADDTLLTGSSLAPGFALNSPEAAAYVAGFASWSANPAGVMRDCCAEAYGGGYA